ncbi:MAG: aromatic ring-hydroxylating dioxygenase subunit alpha [Pseudanabaena frigida]|uniref:Aromatic ring-hydroxylating dioxygenase subunit alpha n=1 Tax=Pseudanabaena frigida TaxID=945775 RepID=A0A2W4VZU0_9CYAN|nr:MAG: aromatic ring-hydroxylating dioxygenase subunit alpha [Pseudanabaena frigida]
MLKNFWYAVEFSDAITSTPKRLKVLNQDIAIYRTHTQQVVAMQDLCVHRGTALSGGWVEGECIVCPYHGWSYQADGTCTNIPANATDIPIPSRAKLTTYDVREKYGWVWIFMGDIPEVERIPIPDLPYFDDSNLKSLHGDFLWNTHYTRVIENLLDIAHVPFVHAGAFGNREQPQIAEFAVDSYPNGAGATVMLNASRPKGLWGFLASKQPQVVKTRTAFFMPNITFLEVHLVFGRLIVYNAHVPIDDRTTVSKWINLRSFFTGNWADDDARKRVLKIFNQDKDIVESQRPQIVPYDLNEELNVQSDALQVEYRKLRRQFLRDR